MICSSAQAARRASAAHRRGGQTPSHAKFFVTKKYNLRRESPCKRVESAAPRIHNEVLCEVSFGRTCMPHPSSLMPPASCQMPRHATPRHKRVRTCFGVIHTRGSYDSNPASPKRVDSATLPSLLISKKSRATRCEAQVNSFSALCLCCRHWLAPRCRRTCKPLRKPQQH